MAILSWLVIFLLFIFLGYAGLLPFGVFIVALAILAVREFYKLTNVCGTPQLVAAALLLGAMAIAVRTGHRQVFYALPGLSPFVFLPLHLLRRSYDNVLRTVSLQVFGLVYWGWLLLHFLLLHRLPGGYGVIILMCTMIALNDNTAYYTGKLLGRNGRKMSPRISPNKTWVGFCGGAIATLASAMLFRYTVPSLSLPKLLVLAVVTACAIPVGDLAESAMKRDLGVKDSGTLIPGHGGVLDRFDSWVFTAPVVYYTFQALSQVYA